MNCEMKMVQLSAINVDVEYQRQADARRIAKAAKAFQSGAVKAISLSRRPDGSLWCYDGQHTIEIMRACGATHVPAVIVNGTQEQEAHWFSLMNGAGVSKATQRDVHKAGVIAGDECSVYVDTLLRKYGVKCAKGGAKAGTTSAIGSLRIWAKQDKTRLDLVLGAVSKLWENEDHAWTQIVLRGMWDCAADGVLDLVISGSRRHKVTPRRILDLASGLQSATGVDGGGSGYAKRAILQLIKAAA